MEFNGGVLCDSMSQPVARSRVLIAYTVANMCRNLEASEFALPEQLTGPRLLSSYIPHRTRVLKLLKKCEATVFSVVEIIPSDRFLILSRACLRIFHSKFHVEAEWIATAPHRPVMRIFQALSVGHIGVRYLPLIRPSRVQRKENCGRKGGKPSARVSCGRVAERGGRPGCTLVMRECVPHS